MRTQPFKHFILPVFLTVCQLLPAQVELEMVHTFGSIGWDNCYGNALDDDGNIYLVGGFIGVVDFDPGPGTHELVCMSDDYGDGFILKLDSLGDFVWVVQIPGIYDEMVYGVDLDAAGNVYLAGQTASPSVDVDPGPGTYILTGGAGISFILKLNSAGSFQWASTYSMKVWGFTTDDAGNSVCSGSGATDIRKYDANGNLLWSKNFGSDYGDSRAAHIDKFGNVWVTGDFWNTLDFDLSAGTAFLTSTGLSDCFVLKLTSAGDYVWAGSYGNASSQDAGDMGLISDASGNIYVGGDFDQTVDFNPGVGVANKTTLDYADAYILKLNNDGIFQWVKTLAGTFLEQVIDMTFDAEGDLYATGDFTYTTDFDPGPGIYNMTAHGDIGANDAYVMKLDDDGNFIWAVSFGGSDHDQPRAIEVDDDGDVIISGHVIGPLDMDPGAWAIFALGEGSYDVFVEKLGQTVCADLTIVFDEVTNAACGDPGTGEGHAISGFAPYEYQWSTDPVTYDSVVAFETSGFYTFSALDAHACMKTSTVLITGPGMTADNDMTGNIVTSGFDPGFQSLIWVDVYNDGCIPSAGSYILVLDDKLEYISSTIEPDNIIGDSLIWFFAGVIYDSAHVVPEVTVLTPADVELGEMVLLRLIINNESDANYDNNNKLYLIEVTGSFDPNDKSVYPAGACDAGYVTHDQLLTYTIRFQNTGTAPAVNIHILDTLSTRHNKNTLRVVASSHPMYTEYLFGDVVNFVFNDIYLPDSSADEAGSHGYVIFEIETKPSAPDGAVVENSAAIYFDFNEPIITNSVINTLVDEVPEFEYSYDQQICSGDELHVGDHIYTEPGTYIDMLQNINGCDSIVTTHLTVMESAVLEQSFEICAGENVMVGDSIYNATGVYVNMLATAIGCDSIVTTYLTVLPVIETENNFEICTGESVEVGDDVYTEPGIYTNILTAASGCDSVVTTFLTVHDIYAAENMVEVCAGDSVVIGEDVYSESGDYVNLFTTIYGCDSTIITHLTVHPVYAEDISAEICAGENYVWNDEVYVEAGVYTAYLTSETGCDSIVVLTLSTYTVNTEVVIDSTYLTADSEEGTFQWVDCDDNYSLIAGETGRSFFPETTGNYAVIVTEGGCTDTSDCYLMMITGIENNMMDVQVYPNPAENILYIVTLGIENEINIKVFGVAGQELKRITYNGDHAALDISTLPSGIYILDIQSTTGIRKLKFVKK